MVSVSLFYFSSNLYRKIFTLPGERPPRPAHSLFAYWLWLLYVFVFVLTDNVS